MTTTRFILILVISIAGIGFYQCKTEKILLGGISGNVTDAETSLPLQETTVILIPANDTTTTASDGKYLFENLTTGNYEIQASKQAYKEKTNSATVTPARTTEINFALNGIPVAKISDKYLDFGVESTTKFLTISNIGKATLKYSVVADQKWINVSPSSGEATNETDTLKVTINRPYLSKDLQYGKILINSIIGQDILSDTVNLLVNGVLDSDFNYYSVIKIGDQIWMAENLNVGTLIAGGLEQTGFQIIKKYCYNNDDSKCKIYGGLYTWTGMMQGAKSDSANIGTTRGICPAGWHIPTLKEWNTLTNYLDETVAGTKIKEAGLSHWKSGNIGTNESGFTALPGGMWDGYIFDLLTSHEYIWTATNDEKSGYHYSTQLEYNSEKLFYPVLQGKQAAGVRCIMNPLRK
jgi:uncharacterized protein (TIGR02145 family)